MRTVFIAKSPYLTDADSLFVVVSKTANLDLIALLLSNNDQK